MSTKVNEKVVAELVAWRIKFEDDRRRRGVPMYGLLFDGDVVTIAQAADEDRPISPATHCSRGHLYDTEDSLGRKRCTICMSLNGRKGVKPFRMAADEDAPHGKCKRGHALALYADGKKYCKACRNESKRQWRLRKKHGLAA